ncbi:ATP-binding cassette domain-containing protein [Zophobihabitans entericus]|uniref:ABC transporter ATP-binding protein n=1 Tax=Zophobihabitans entericus TaxID=1635327 RepID=A0A6G9IB79_9GAMM|nr:ATP-binding cassette domain-containing protein [Zophobihabitans entericus]QIQ21486.1 ABC transporter ATP-binding protein [Zophobihabitans entericus]
METVQASPASIILQDVNKHFDNVEALKPLTITIKAGGVTGVVGPDGAGKTTLLRMMAGLLEASAGSLNVAGLDPIKNRSELRDILGYMPQKFGLYEDLTVIENLNLFADLRNIQGEERTKTFNQLLDFTDLHRFTDRLAGKLSGGMKQKLGVACTLLGQPKVLLLDEPGVGVDPISRRELWKMVHTLAHEGMLIIWSTAYLDEAEQCENILLLNEGKLLFNGEPMQLTHQVSERVVLVSSNYPHRTLLQQALKLPEISDGVIQGNDIRLILKSDVTLDTIKDKLVAIDNIQDIKVVPTAGRFEDAFIDLLGGVEIKESVLTKIMQPIEGSKDEVVIEAQDLTKQFGDFVATNHVNFQVKRGEIFGLLGPNGAGKSTTFKMMCGLLKISAGQALVLGMSLAKSPTKVRQRLGYMAQKFSLYDKLTILQNLQFFSGIYGLVGKEQNERIEEMLTAFNFHSIQNKDINYLSLGFKQRLALACALMHKPDVLFLDEPTSGVDPVTRREFWMHINSLVDKGVTVMVTTHFMDEAEYCDRIGLVYQGKLIALGSPDDLKQQVATQQQPNPTMEDAFIELVLAHDKEQVK